MRRLNKRGLVAASLLAACLVAAGGAYAQEKKEEEPFWAKGRPKEGPGCEDGAGGRPAHSDAGR